MKIKVKCKMCGKCCRAIGIDADFDRIKNSYTKKGEVSLGEIFAPITKEEAFRRNKDLKNTQNATSPYFYKCVKFKCGKCSIHFNGKPSICSGFPFYEDTKPYGFEGPFVNYSTECPYNLKEKQALYDGYKLTGRHYREWKAWKENEIAKKEFLTAQEAEKLEVVRRDELCVPVLS